MQTVTVVTSYFLRFGTSFDIRYVFVASVTLPQFQTWPVIPTGVNEALSALTPRLNIDFDLAAAVNDFTTVRTVTAGRQRFPFTSVIVNAHRGVNV